MEVKRYDFETAQHEADQIRQMIETGEATDYKEAENQLEQLASSPKESINEDKVREYLEIINEALSFRGDQSKFDSLVECYKDHPTKEIEEAATKSMLTAAFLDTVIYVQSKLQLPAKIFRSNLELQAIIKKLASKLEYGSVNTLIEAVNLFPLPKNYWQSPEFQEPVIKRWDNGTFLDGGRFEMDFTSSLINEKLPKLVGILFPNPKIFTDDERAKTQAKSLIAAIFRYYNLGEDNNYSHPEKIDSIINCILFFHIEKDDPDIQPLLPKIEKEIIKVIKKSLNLVTEIEIKEINKMLHAQVVFGFSKELCVDLGKERMAELLATGNFEQAKRLKEVFHFPDTIIVELFNITKKKGSWKNMIALANFSPECAALYKNTVEENREIIHASKDAKERKDATLILSGLAHNGDNTLLNEFYNIICNRATQSETPDTQTNLTHDQEVAFSIIKKLDNPDSNRILFDLAMNKNVSPAVKRSALSTLTNPNRNFLNSDARTCLQIWLHSAPAKKLDYNDLQYIKALETIPSTELRLAAQKHIARGMHAFNNYETPGKNQNTISENISGIAKWAETHTDIPAEAVLPLNAMSIAVVASLWENEILPKFTKLYGALRKDSAKKSDLLFGIIGFLNISFNLQKLLLTKLAELEFGSKQDADGLSKLFRQIIFLDKTYTNQTSYTEQEEENGGWAQDVPTQSPAQPTTIDANVQDIFAQRIRDVTELSNQFERVITDKIRRILPHPEITAKKIQHVQESWGGDIEPIITYTGRYSNNSQYIAEMVAHFDSPENWQAWRYDENSEIVEGQIGHLTPAQRLVWKANYAAELGDVLVAQSTIDKPAHIRTLLTDAIVRDRHICNPEAGFAKHQTIQAALETTLAKAQTTPNQGSEVFEATIGEVKEDTEQLDIILKAAAASKIRQMLEKNFPASGVVRYNAPTNSAINELVNWLPKDLAEKLVDSYKQVEKVSEKKEEKQKPTDTVLDTTMREVIAQKIEAVANRAQEITANGTIFDKYGLDKSNQKNLTPYYQKRQELKTVIDLLRLSNLSNRRIATNRIAEQGTQKEGGETITTVLENLKKFFKDSPLLQDLKNIEFTLQEEQKFGERRRLAMVVTDNPQMTWQAGKYPLGNGSCQHYAEGSMAESLMGYVGDAHLKTAYLLDLNALPLQYQELFQTHSISDAILQHIPAQELLNASLARSIVKIGKKVKSPIVILAPTYSAVNKGDVSMDSYFNLFVDLFLAEPMKIPMARGAGDDMVEMPASRNPYGQYEDGAGGNAADAGMGIQGGVYTVAVNIIGKAHRPTAEETAIVERMRSSSNQ